MYACFRGTDFYHKNIDYALGIAHFDIGQFKEAKKHLEKALSVADAKRRREHIESLLKEIEIKMKKEDDA